MAVETHNTIFNLDGHPYVPASWSQTIPHSCHVERDTFLVALAREKSVFHIGATDSPFTKDRLASGNLLHIKLRSAAKRLSGIDRDLEAITYLENATGVVDIVHGDAQNPPQTAGGRFQAVYCCDIIEHVGNPEALLLAARQYMADDGLLVISTINSTSAKAVARSATSREAVHFDHVAYYSYATLGALLSRVSLKPRGVYYFSYPESSFLSKIVFRPLHRVRPATADGIIVIATALPK